MRKNPPQHTQVRTLRLNEKLDQEIMRLAQHYGFTEFSPFMRFLMLDALRRHRSSEEKGGRRCDDR